MAIPMEDICTCDILEDGSHVVEEEKFENERFRGSWMPCPITASLRKDHPQFSSEDGRTDRRRVYLPRDWVWITDWRVDDKNSESGWMYARLLGKEFFPEEGTLSRVRRKRWTRSRKYTGVTGGCMAKSTMFRRPKNLISGTYDTKGAGYFRSYTKRLCVINDDDELWYFDEWSPRGTKGKNGKLIMLSDAISVSTFKRPRHLRHLGHRGGNGCGFKVHTEERVFWMQLSKIKERDKWVEIIRAAIDKYTQARPEKKSEREELRDLTNLLKERLRKESLIRDRVWGLRKRTYPNCFVGSEAVSIMVKREFASNRQDAVKLGQRMLQADLIRHVLNVRDFKDTSFLFFKFVDDTKDAYDEPKVPSKGKKKRKELKNLSKTLRDGLLHANEIQDRDYGLWQKVTYPICFVGAAVCTWLVKHEHAKDGKEALKIGQKLLEANLIHHVLEEHHFKNSNDLFYRFTVDDDEAAERSEHLKIQTDDTASPSDDGPSSSQNTTIKVPWHRHPLLEKSDYMEWMCSGSEQPERCAKGFTSKHQTYGQTRHSCDECNYHLCAGCVIQAKAEPINSSSPFTEEVRVEADDGKLHDTLPKYVKPTDDVKCEDEKWLEAASILAAEETTSSHITHSHVSDRVSDRTSDRTSDWTSDRNSVVSEMLNSDSEQKVEEAVDHTKNEDEYEEIVVHTVLQAKQKVCEKHGGHEFDFAFDPAGKKQICDLCNAVFLSDYIGRHICKHCQYTLCPSCQRYQLTKLTHLPKSSSRKSLTGSTPTLSPTISPTLSPTLSTKQKLKNKHDHSTKDGCWTKWSDYCNVFCK